MLLAKLNVTEINQARQIEEKVSAHSNKHTEAVPITVEAQGKMEDVQDLHFNNNHFTLDDRLGMLNADQAQIFH